jgi:endonuclease/exonuclease/phosphatase family metal-dependent hydrolase
VRVVSANLQHGVPDPVGPPDLSLAVGPLRDLAADVYAFQELDHLRWRTRLAHQGRALAAALDGELLWARAKHWLWAAQGNALVVRGELVAREVRPLPGPDELRSVAIAEVVVAGGRWSVAGTHLSLDRTAATAQLRAVVEALADRPAPRVVLGDLNLRPERVAPVAEELGYQLVDGPFTINARTGLNRRLDHVLVDGASIDASGVEKLPVSDHLAVWADLS